PSHRARRRHAPSDGPTRRAGKRSPRRPPTMNDVTRILSAIKQGDPQASEKLLTLVYDELRRLAYRKLARDEHAQTQQAAALVKLRLFAGLTVEQAASALEVSRRTAERDWTFARTWLFGQLGPRDEPD